MSVRFDDPELTTAGFVLWDGGRQFRVFETMPGTPDECVFTLQITFVPGTVSQVEAVAESLLLMFWSGALTDPVGRPTFFASPCCGDAECGHVLP